MRFTTIAASPRRSARAWPASTAVISRERCPTLAPVRETMVRSGSRTARRSATWLPRKPVPPRTTVFSGAPTIITRKYKRFAASANLRVVARVHGEIEGKPRKTFAGVYALVRRIPKGRVMTYGQIAMLLESRLSPRAVGWAMHGCPSGVPWQRVVNATGGMSTDRIPEIPAGMQRAILEGEGIRFRPSGKLDLEKYRWLPFSKR